MPTALGSLRRLALTPSLTEVSFAGRGFPVVETAATRRLEAIPQAVVTGFEWGIDAAGLPELERKLALVEPEQRGFAYEGATMALTIVDTMGRSGNRAQGLLAGPGRPHTFLTYIGIGFAMARLPRPLWKGILPDLTGTPYYPTMSWLAVDGYGFDLAYFHTGRWVDAQRQPKPYPWQGRPDYFSRAVDQGIGRALWFIHGGRPEPAAAAVDRFAAGRHGDLWSGVGLAATFAGGAAAGELGTLVRRSGPHRADLAQGAVFAAKARHFSGFVPQHTEDACGVLTGLPVAAAAEVADDFVPGPEAGGPVPQYELWRTRIRELVTV